LRYVLCDFERSDVLLVRISHREIAYVDKPVVKVYPELGNVLSSAAKIVEYLLHYVRALGRMAVLHLSPQNGLASVKDETGCAR